jgi:hypothetical protein
MKIETKFSVNDKVWLLHNNKIINSEILSISILVTHKGKIEEKYALKEISNVYTGITHPYFENIFTTKEELINSL